MKLEFNLSEKIREVEMLNKDRSSTHFIMNAIIVDDVKEFIWRLSER